MSNPLEWLYRKTTAPDNQTWTTANNKFIRAEDGQSVHLLRLDTAKRPRGAVRVGGEMLAPEAVVEDNASTDGIIIGCEPAWRGVRALPARALPISEMPTATATSC
jgi:hypothetical protein